MKRMLKPGDHVTLVRDRSQDNRDYYGRLLRYVELADGTSAASESAGAGLGLRLRHPFRRLGSDRRAQSNARGADRGAWGQCGGLRLAFAKTDLFWTDLGGAMVPNCLYFGASGHIARKRHHYCKLLSMLGPL